MDAKGDTEVGYIVLNIPIAFPDESNLRCYIEPLSDEKTLDGQVVHDVAAGACRQPVFSQALLMTAMRTFIGRSCRTPEPPRSIRRLRTPRERRESDRTRYASPDRL